MQQELRRAFGSFGTGIAIVAVRGPDGQAYGLTINSFASVSLEPALLSWCLANESDMMGKLSACERFSVNILAATQKDISNRLAMSGDHKIAADEYEIGDQGGVLLTGALAHFQCHVHEKIEAGDHVLFLGGIDHASYCPEGLAPLIYFRGEYSSLQAERDEK